jgi:hypothetical protein
MTQKDRLIEFLENENRELKVRVAELEGKQSASKKHG